MVGLILYGAATLQAKVLPRWCGIAFIVVLPVTILLGDYGGMFFGLVWLAQVLPQRGHGPSPTIAAAAEAGPEPAGA